MGFILSEPKIFVGFWQFSGENQIFFRDINKISITEYDLIRDLIYTLHAVD